MSRKRPPGDFAMIIFLTVAVAVLALYFVLFVRAPELPAPASTSPLAALEEKRAVVLENLRDLEFEFNLGKLTREDFERARGELEKELGALGESATEPARPAAAAAQPAADAVAVCRRCGASFAQAMKFCGECGAPMNGGNA